MQKKSRIYGYVSYPRSQHLAVNHRRTRNHQSRQKFDITKYGKISIGVACLIVLGLIIIPRSSSDKAPLSLTETLAAQDEVEKIPEIDTTQMAAEIDAVIAANPGLDISVAVYDIKGDKQHTFGTDAGYVAASVSKLITASFLLHEVEAGRLTLDTPILGVKAGEHLKRLIVNSDNASWKALNDHLGRPAMLAFATEHGLENYSTADNIISTKDVSLLLMKIYNKEVLNEQHTQLLLSCMQKANNNNYISTGLPAGSNLYHKAGWLDDRIHDAAIIDNGDRPYVLVIFSKSHTGAYPKSAVGIFTAITRSTANTYLVKQAEATTE